MVIHCHEYFALYMSICFSQRRNPGVAFISGVCYITDVIEIKKHERKYLFVFFFFFSIFSTVVYLGDITQQFLKINIRSLWLTPINRF